METSPRGIAVYGASSRRIHPKYFEAAREVGKGIARAGLIVVNGGGSMGLMGATIDGALEAGGECIGVIPRFMDERGWAHDALTDLRVTETMHERKALMASLSRGVIALPGGIGTFDEMCEIMTWVQLELFHGPVVILNLDGFYDPFIQMLEKADAEGFMRTAKGILYVVATTPEEAVALATATPQE